MSKHTNIADILIHLHPELSLDDTSCIEKWLRKHDGIVNVHINSEQRPYSILVAYNSKATSSNEVLVQIRRCDRSAVMLNF